MSSDETSINSDTKPSVHTVTGTSRHVTEAVLPGSELIYVAYDRGMRRPCASSRPDGGVREEKCGPGAL